MSKQRGKRYLGRLAMVRLVTMISILTVSMGGVAYAALQSQTVTLTGNSIQTASAGLQVSSNGTTFATSQAGFNFADIIPGGSAVPANGNLAYLRNVGTTALAVKMMVTGTPANLDNVDLSKVHVIITPISGGSVQNFTLAALIASNTSGGLSILSAANLLTGATYNFRIQVQMDSDAVTSSIATINNLDFAFSGVAVAP